MVNPALLSEQLYRGNFILFYYSKQCYSGGSDPKSSTHLRRCLTDGRVVMTDNSTNCTEGKVIFRVGNIIQKSVMIGLNVSLEVLTVNILKRQKNPTHIFEYHGNTQSSHVH